MRLVSKSWLTAVRAHPMNPKPIIVKANPDLAKLCGIVPHMAGLDFECTEEQLDLGPLSAQSSLTHLSICGGRRFSAQTVITGANLSRLPSSLRSLALRNIDVPPDSLGSLRFASLRSLTFCPVSLCHTPKELLICLPNLEVHVTGFCNSPRTFRAYLLSYLGTRLTPDP